MSWNIDEIIWNSKLQCDKSTNEEFIDDDTMRSNVTIFFVVWYLFTHLGIF